MKQLKHIFNIIFSIFLLGACSCLTKVSSLEIKKSKGWIGGDICESCESFGWYMQYDYEYKMATHDSLSISVCPRLYYYTIAMGPPLYPVIPNPRLLFPKKWSKFDVVIKFQNFKGKTIDINSLQYGVKKSKRKIIPDKIGLLTYRRNGADTTELTEQKFYVNSDTLYLLVHFNIPQNKVKRFSINFENFIVNDSIIHFPILNLKRKSRFLYDPLMIGH